MLRAVGERVRAVDRVATDGPRGRQDGEVPVSAAPGAGQVRQAEAVDGRVVVVVAAAVRARGRVGAEGQHAERRRRPGEGVDLADGGATGAGADHRVNERCRVAHQRIGGSPPPGGSLRGHGGREPDRGHPGQDDSGGLRTPPASSMLEKKHETPNRRQRCHQCRLGCITIRAVHARLAVIAPQAATFPHGSAALRASGAGCSRRWRTGRPGRSSGSDLQVRVRGGRRPRLQGEGLRGGGEMDGLVVRSHCRSRSRGRHRPCPRR